MAQRLDLILCAYLLSGVWGYAAPGAVEELCDAADPSECAEKGSSFVQLKHKNLLKSTDNSHLVDQEQAHELDQEHQLPEHMRCWLFTIRFDKSNGHVHEGTNDEICLSATLGLPYNGNNRQTWAWQQCNNVPKDDDEFDLGATEQRHCGLGFPAFTLSTQGQDALLVDQIIVEQCQTTEETMFQGCASERTEILFGGNNNVGWCLSTQASDWRGFGRKAWQSRCCKSLQFNPSHPRTDNGGANVACDPA